LNSYVDVELRSLFGLFPSIDFRSNSRAEIRDNVGLCIRDYSTDNPFPVSVESAMVPGIPGNPDIKVLIYLPVAQAISRPAILHIHGGGYVMGSPLLMYIASRQLAAELDCVVVSVAYRLAAEHVFQAAIDDCYAALGWLFRNADSLGVDVMRVGVKGKSAGGGLAVPARAAELSGLPPTFIAVGSLDIFLDENLDYAKRLAAAGVPVELQVFPGAFHGFDMIPGVAIA
jgi:acetyl esterase/lipase